MEPHGASILIKGFQIVTREGRGGETWDKIKQKNNLL
jgi:hypothetical protein